MSLGSKNAAEVAAEREEKTYGCCCKCCSVRCEIWACFVIDITSIIGLLVEIPSWYPVPANLHAVDELRAFLAFSVLSAGIILFALFMGNRMGWPRMILVNFMSLKIPIFLIFYMGYFTVSPWASPLAKWICGRDFQQMRTTVGGDYEFCLRMFPWLCTLNNAPYLFVYAYTFKAAHDWFRCHPSNDGKGIWCLRVALAQESDDYTRLEHGG